ncbi:AAA family ATPase [Bacteroidota bacterium]
MENNILLKYMEKRFSKKKEQITSEIPGPVITLSRESGCPAKRIAKILALSLNKRKESKTPNWKCVSKEILNESAKELELNPSQIKYVFDFEQRGVWDDIMSSLSSKYYKSDRKIRKTIADVIRTISEQGNVIIIGRGSVAITRDLPNSFHINLEAPLEWRAEMISLKAKMKLEEARHYAIETDKKREKFRDSFYGQDTDYTRFDVTFNCMTFKDEEIVNAIIKLLEIRGLI